jgi:ATP-dependent protease HslVU (ClpYQ) ATPase subunit
MKLNQVLEQMGVTPQATQSTDVEGVKKTVGPIVRRVVPAGYTKDERKPKKKKNVVEDAFQQLDSEIANRLMSRHWVGDSGTEEEKKKIKKKKNEFQKR